MSTPIGQSCTARADWQIKICLHLSLNIGPYLGILFHDSIDFLHCWYLHKTRYCMRIESSFTNEKNANEINNNTVDSGDIYNVLYIQIF